MRPKRKDPKGRNKQAMEKVKSPNRDQWKKRKGGIMVEDISSSSKAKEGDNGCDDKGF